MPEPYTDDPILAGDFDRPCWSAFRPSPRRPRRARSADQLGRTVDELDRLAA
jgi:hypothetical protein